MPTFSYGPPGHKGVSRLLAVGDADYDSRADAAVKTGSYLAGAVVLTGMLTGSRTVRNLGAGALAALLGVRWATKPKQVVVAAPQAPPAASGW
jgi:hypothetical protein